jgi:hypothetical protein
MTEAETKPKPKVEEAKPVTALSGQGGGAATAEPAPVVHPITEGRVVLNIAGQVNQQFRAVTTAGTPFEAVLDPRYWTHVATKFHIGDEINVESDDRLYVGKLYVRHCERTYAHVEVMVFKQFTAAMPLPLAGDHAVRYAGPHKQWTVLDLKSGRTLKEQIPTQEVAQAFLKSYLQAQMKVA